MEQSSGVRQINSGFLYMCADFGLRVPGTSSERIAEFGAERHEVGGIIKARIPLSYWLFVGAMPERHSSAEEHLDSLSD